jgi:hypothetical protein
MKYTKTSEILNLISDLILYETSLFRIYNTHYIHRN